MEQVEMMKLLDTLYQKCGDGIPNFTPPVWQMAGEYLGKCPDRKTAAKKFINNQVIKCTTSGFLTGLGGVITLPVAVPANVGSVLYVQMRMITGLACIGGYDVDSDEVQTLVYACLAGVSVTQLVKTAGINIGMKMSTAAIKRIPGKALTAINQKVGFRLVTKFGTKGAINLGKAVPIVGGVLGGGFDFVETKAIASRAYKMFIEGDFEAADDGTVSEEPFIEVEAVEHVTAEVVGEVPAEDRP